MTWRNESQRHSLARRGIKTAVTMDKVVNKVPVKKSVPKGWNVVENDSYIMYSNAVYPIEIGDVYTFIEFVKPKHRTNEIGYLYITKKKVNWLGSGGTHSTTTIKEVLSKHPLTREEGIKIVEEYMRLNKHG